ncbi:FtsW/RodA/SpoVE family cell cycle protein [Candidatus Epulonipiscium viviparus]|uniref:FtsW/RodA/SpoVE family cell cycle protein n=1 Tax=Candidatus Epulonipiscium viviparus TaxID=420336 RepID=UPI0004966A95|nr:FtsW/RodA/SpoVE family cell cycle protein [Candidatus Epulopiscium viviparus]
MFNKKIALKNLDVVLIVLMCALIAIGILAISSATSFSGDLTPLVKQIIFFVIGLILMTIVTLIDYRKVGEHYVIIYVVMNVILLAVLIFGVANKGARRWINLGFIEIQPSEFAKIIIIFCTAKLISLKNEKINSVITIGKILLFQFVPFILINRQPNLSTSIVILTLLVVQLFVSNLKLKYIFSTALIGLVIICIGVGYIIKNPNQQIIDNYQRDRIVAAFSGGDSQSESYQTSRSIDAIGSGGLYGKGIYKGAISQLNYLPESHNDFIVANIAEEFGFYGIIALLAIILLFIFRGLYLARNLIDDFGKFIIVGYMGMIAAQSFINFGVVTGLLPNTGLTLPFVSYGGSSLWANMIGMGLVLSVILNKEEMIF